jgi:hypothetical protein
LVHYFISSPERAPEMAQTLVQVLLHVVFSTKEHRPFLKEAWRDELFAYMGGIVRNLGGMALSINGVATMCTCCCRCRQRLRPPTPCA